MHGTSRSQTDSVPSRKFLGSNAFPVDESIRPSVSPENEKAEVENNDIASEVGLAVFHSGGGIQPAQLSDEPCLVSIAQPPYNWPTANDSTGPATLNPPLNDQQYPQAPYYHSHYEPSTEHSPWMSLPDIYRHDPVPPFYYNPDLQSKEDYSPNYSETSEAWAMRPSAPAASSSTVSTRQRDPETPAWEVPVSFVPVFSGFGDVRDDLNIMRSPAMHALLNSYPLQTNNRNTLVELDVNRQQYADGLTSSDTSPADLKKERARLFRTTYLPADIGLRCYMCGVSFTRRTNCRVHMKQHDPDRRQGHRCESCGKSFGRKTDLRRHLSSVSLFADQRDGGDRLRNVDSDC